MTDFQIELFGLNGIGRQRELTEAKLDEIWWDLNGFNGAKVSMSPLAVGAKEVLTNKTELFIRIGTEYMAVVPRAKGGDLSSCTFECEGVASYFSYMYITDDLDFVDIDQFTIAWTLINAGQTGTNADRNIDAGSFSESGILRDRSYKGDELPNVADMLKNLTELQDGIDWEVKTLGDGRREWWPYYPSRGTFKPQFAIEIDRWGRSFGAQLAGFKEDGFAQFTRAFVTGATVRDDTVEPPTEDKLIGSYEDTAASAEFGRMTKSFSEGSIDSINWLNDQAEGNVAVSKAPYKIPDLAVSAVLLGQVFPGDTIPVRIDYGAYQMNETARITKLIYRGTSDDIKLEVQPA